MLNKLKQQRESGFTIIEVMIVLAIAGLIMVVVFLAVPALQRSSRNTSAKNDATNILGAANELVSNNSGKALTAGSSGTAGTNAKTILDNAKTANITTITVEGNTGTTQPTETLAVIRTNTKCSAATGANTAAVATAGTSDRQMVVLYRTESSSAATVSCQEG